MNDFFKIEFIEDLFLAIVCVIQFFFGQLIFLFSPITFYLTFLYLILS